MRANFGSFLIAIALVAFAFLGFAFGRLQLQRDFFGEPASKVGREVKRTVFATKFTDLAETQKSAEIHLDYAFLFVSHPRLDIPKSGIQPPASMPKPSASEEKTADLAVDPVRAALTKLIEDDRANWQRAVRSLTGASGPTKIEVIDFGSVGYTYMGPGSIKRLVAPMKASLKDPIRASYEYEFLLCQSKGNRIGGLQRYKHSNFLNTFQAEWSPTDFEPGKVTIEKRDITQTSCNLIVFRVSAKESAELPYGIVRAGMAGPSGPYNLDREALRKELIRFNKLKQSRNSTLGVATEPKLD